MVHFHLFSHHSETIRFKSISVIDDQTNFHELIVSENLQ